MDTLIKQELRELPLDALSRGRYQPRRHFAPELLEELAQSIREQGVIEPIIVRPIADGRYEIIAGERRWRASEMAGRDTVPAVVRNYTDEQAAEVTLIENIQREDLNPIEEAMAYQQLMDEFNYIHEEIATAVGKSRSRISNALRLLKLDARVQQMLIAKIINEGHGKMLASLPSHEQYVYAEKCAKNGWSVRKIEQELKNRSVQPAMQSSQDANISRLERSVSEQLGADVQVENDGMAKSGWLKIRYQDYEILSGILQKIGIDVE